MLRIIERQAEAQAELKRISNRTIDNDIQPQEAMVRDIVANVRAKGDRALLEYTKKRLNQ